MKIEIKSRWDSRVLYSAEAESVRVWTAKPPAVAPRQTTLLEVK